MLDLPLPLAGGGLAGLLVVVFFPYIQMARGRLVPRSTLEAQERIHEREIEDLCHDRDEWRTAHRLSEQGRGEERENTTVLVRELGITNDALRSLKEAADRHREQP